MFPNGELTAPGFHALLDLATSGVIAILDAEFVTVDHDGVPRRASITEPSGPGSIDLSAWEGAATGLIDDEDLQISC